MPGLVGNNVDFPSRARPFADIGPVLGGELDFERGPDPEALVPKNLADDLFERIHPAP